MVAAIIPVSSVTPVIAAESVGPNVTLQPGSVVDARVLQVLADDFVRIAVSSLSIEVATEVPLQAGQTLQLAVSQTADGVRLQIVPQDGNGAAQAATSSATTISPSIAAGQIASTDPATVTRALTPAEAVAVSHALQTGAARQGGLSPLFADLTAAATSGQLPAGVQQAAAALLGARTALTTQLTGQEFEAAFKKSGLFLEQSQAAQRGGPDLKAALIVLQQTLSSWLSETSSDAAANTPSWPGSFVQQGQARAQSDGNPAPPLAPEIQMEEMMLPGAVVAVAGEIEDLGMPVNGAFPSSMRAQAGDPLALQELVQSFPKDVQDAMETLLAGQNRMQTTSSAKDGLPPPFRGATPSAQAIAASGVDDQMASGVVARRLLSETDAALARQTLLQIASLPDQGHGRVDLTPRWNFEIPFMTPQGTAVAQFEISRDGGGKRGESEPEDRVWRARFSLNLEPAGPVHAQISLSGERTSVRMWAERPATAAQLRTETPKLSQALREAELTPGDIIVGNGAPPSPAPENGHFLDRAL